MTLSPLNIGHTLALATDAEWESGAAWYSEAHALALSLTPNDPRVAAGVIAALSPRAGWSVNKKWAIESVAAGVGVGNTLPNRAKASRILAGQSLADAFAKAPKTGAFAATIADPTTDAVTIDIHALSVAAGYRCKESDYQRLGRKGEYDRVSDMYRAVASQWGMMVSAVQAITWVSYRNVIGINHLG
jgi:hypothetical protein